MQTDKVDKIKSNKQLTMQQRAIAAGIFIVIAGGFTFLNIAQRHGIDVSQVFNPCGFKQRYGLPCPSCGMTTATLAFARGQIFKAFWHQPAAAFFCCVFIIVGILSAVMAVAGRDFGILKFCGQVKAGHLLIAILIIFGAGWAVTLSRALAKMQ